MALTASKVTAGMQMLASHINKIIDDILNHTHASGEGGVVPHSSLSDGTIISPADTYLNHADINKHVQGSGTTAHGSDNPGGSQGVHGLSSTANVAGVFGGKYHIRTGVGSFTGTASNGYFNYLYGDVTWTPSFSAVPMVLITLATVPDWPTDSRITLPFVTNRAVGGFRGCLGATDGVQVGDQFTWVAIGTMA